MSGSRRVPSPRLADFATVVCAQEPKVTMPILVPISEREWTTKFRNSDFSSDNPRPISTEAHNEAMTDVPPLHSPKSIERISHSHEFTRVDSPEPKIHHLKNAAEPDTAATPTPEKPLHAFYSAKEEFSFSGRFVAASATLALIAGIAAGFIWSWKSAPSSNIAASERLIVDRLNAITGELSSLRHDLKNLVASQRLIAEKQEQLSAAQGRLSVAQEQATAKQDHVPSIPTSRLRKTTRP